MLARFSCDEAICEFGQLLTRSPYATECWPVLRCSDVQKKPRRERAKSACQQRQNFASLDVVNCLQSLAMTEKGYRNHITEKIKDVVTMKISNE